MTTPITVLVAARDEEERIGQTVAALMESFPDAEIVVADDGSRDRTAAHAAEARQGPAGVQPRFGEDHRDRTAETRRTRR